MNSHSYTPELANNQPTPVQSMNIRFLSPTDLALYSTFIFFICLPILPVDVKYPMTIEALFFWLLCFISYLFGTVLGAGRNTSMRLRQYQTNPKKVRKFLAVLIMLGLIGTILSYIDRFLMRGASLTADALENREALTDSKASALSVVAAITSSFGLISYIMIWVAELGQIVVSRWLKSLALVSVLFAFYSTMQLGSRSLLLVIILIHLFAWFFVLHRQGGKVRFKHKLMVFLILISLATLSSIIMVTRVDLMGILMSDSTLNSGYAYVITPAQFILDAFGKNPSMEAMLAGLFSLVQYVFHGIYEFSLLFNNFQGNYEWGARTLWLPIKVGSMLTEGWIHVDSFKDTGERIGVFTTYVGPVFIDFGLFSPIALIVFGVLLGFPFRFLRAGQVEWLPTVVLVATSTLLWPVVNIFASASGTYLLVGTVAVGLIGKRLRKAQ